MGPCERDGLPIKTTFKKKKKIKDRNSTQT